MKRMTLLLLVVLLFLTLRAQTISETLAQLEQLRDELREKEILLEHNISELFASDPLFAAQDQFESDLEYIERCNKNSPRLLSLRDHYLGESVMKLAMLRSRSFVTNNVNVTFGDYNANLETWNISVQHNEFDNEKIDFVANITADNAMKMHNNQDNLSVTGLLTIGLGDRVSLSRVVIRDPISGSEITQIIPLRKFVREYKERVRYYYGLEVYFSPDGKYTAGVETFNQYEDGSGDKCAVSLFDTATHEKIWSQAFNRDYRRFYFSPNSKLFSAIKYDHQSSNLLVYDIENRKVLNQINMPYSTSWNFGHDSVSMESITSKRYLKFSLADPENVVHLKSFEYVKPIFSSDGMLYARPSEKGLGVYNQLTNKQLIMMLPGLYFSDVVFSHSGKFISFLAKPDPDKWGGEKIYVYDIAKNKVVMSVGDENRLVLSPVGDYIAMVDYKTEETNIIDLNTGKSLMVFDKNMVNNKPKHVCFSPDGCYIAIGDTIYNSFISYSIEQ